MKKRKGKKKDCIFYKSETNVWKYFMFRGMLGINALQKKHY